MNPLGIRALTTFGGFLVILAALAGILAGVVQALLNESLHYLVYKPRLDWPQH